VSRAATSPDDERGLGEPALARWERGADWPLTALAVVFLAGYAWQVLDASAPPSRRAAIDVALWLIWGVFTADYVIRFALARRKARFLWRHLFDLVAVALPMLRQLRVLRVISAVNILNRRAATAVHGRVAVYVAGVTALVGTCAALAVLDAERGDPNATITTFPDALWWTLTTISTVGYGDRYPVTPEGRLVAAGLMIAGIALLGVITGTIASWFVDRIRGFEQSMENRIHDEMRSLRAEIAALRAELVTGRADRSRPTEPEPMAHPSTADPAAPLRSLRPH